MRTDCCLVRFFFKPRWGAIVEVITRALLTSVCRCCLVCYSLHCILTTPKRWMNQSCVACSSALSSSSPIPLPPLPHPACVHDSLLNGALLSRGCSRKADKRTPAFKELAKRHGLLRFLCGMLQMCSTNMSQCRYFCNLLPLLGLYLLPPALSP